MNNSPNVTTRPKAPANDPLKAGSPANEPLLIGGRFEIRAWHTEYHTLCWVTTDLRARAEHHRTSYAIDFDGALANATSQKDYLL